MKRMWISDFAIRRPLITVVTMLTLVAFGVAALINLQTDEFPDVAQPIVAVTIVYPGAAPDVVEREVIDPVEEAIFGLSGVDRDKTVANAVDGLAQFTVFFDYRKPVAEAAQDVRDAISTIRSNLPTEMEEPVISRFDPTEQSVLSLTVTAPNMDARALTQIADPTVVRALRGMSGVAQATVVGGSYPEMTVQLKPDAMQAAGIGVNDIVAALGTQNLAAPVGRINSALQEESIRLKGRPEDAAAFQQVVIAQRNGSLIHLGDVAEVFEGNEELRTAASYNGHDAVGIEIKKSKGYSTTQVVAALKKEIARVQPMLPGGARIDVVRDAGFRVTKAVDNVQTALIEGALLTVLVVFLFLNSWRSTVITGLALPVSGVSELHRRLGVRLHTEYHVAARAVTGDRHPDRRRDRGPREHRAARRDGEGPLQRRAGRDSGDRARRHGDDVFDRMRVRADCLHVGTVGPMVQTIRAHHRVRRAGVAVRVVLARSDAVGLLARPAQACRREGMDHATARQVQSPVCPADRRLCQSHWLGTRPSMGDGGARPGVVLWRIDAAGEVRRRRLRAALRPERGGGHCRGTGERQHRLYPHANRGRRRTGAQASRSGLYRMPRSAARCPGGRLASTRPTYMSSWCPKRIGPFPRTNSAPCSGANSRLSPE